MSRKINLDTAEADEIAAFAAKDDELLAQLIDMTAGDDRKARSKAALALEQLSATDPERLVGYSAELADALHRPEAKTRWAILSALTNLIPVDSRSVDKALSGAEASLYDEDSGPARLAAFRFLAFYGQTTEARSERVWPLLDEALQCYHGDSEFNDMMTATLSFAAGKLAPGVRKGLIARMAFDSENSRGQLGRRAKQVIDTASGHKGA